MEMLPESSRRAWLGNEEKRREDVYKDKAKGADLLRQAVGLQLENGDSPGRCPGLI
jgi:hypothetical protein